jgi:hypothetical protein
MEARHLTLTLTLMVASLAPTNRLHVPVDGSVHVEGGCHLGSGNRSNQLGAEEQGYIRVGKAGRMSAGLRTNCVVLVAPPAADSP